MGQERSLTKDRVLELLDFDPLTGIFRWKAKAAKNTIIGAVAGTSNGESYRYIRIDKEDYPVSRLAWFIVHGEWPRRLRFHDGDRTNCAISNMFVGQGLSDKFDCRTPEGRRAFGRAHRKEFPRFYKAADLKRDFGITLAEYDEMLEEQDGKCAICRCAETVMRGGKLKGLAVDHNHKTGKVRQLLCQACNMMVGHSRENPEIMLAATQYLARHAVLSEDTALTATPADLGDHSIN